MKGLQRQPGYLEAPVIRTERLLLRPYRLEDFGHLQALYQTERAAYIGGKMSARRVWDGFMNCIGQWPVFGFGAWAVEQPVTGELVGEVALQRPPDYPETELGWLLFQGHEGKGYAQEAAVAARRFAMEETSISSLVSYIDRDNLRSIRLAERLGAVRDDAAATPNGDPCHVFRHLPA